MALCLTWNSSPHRCCPRSARPLVLCSRCSAPGSATGRHTGSLETPHLRKKSLFNFITVKCVFCNKILSQKGGKNMLPADKKSHHYVDQFVRNYRQQHRRAGIRGRVCSSWEEPLWSHYWQKKKKHRQPQRLKVLHTHLLKTHWLHGVSFTWGTHSQPRDGAPAHSRPATRWLPLSTEHRRHCFQIFSTAY